MTYSIVRLIDKPELKQQAAQWFSDKWGIPLSAYLDSMDKSLNSVIPQWYLVLEEDRIISGLGVIDNDFHMRKDLSPNICAVYTEEDKRGLGIMARLLTFVENDLMNKGIETLYLLTDHTSYYERYGWEFIGMVKEESGQEARMYQKDLILPNLRKNYRVR